MPGFAHRHRHAPRRVGAGLAALSAVALLAACGSSHPRSVHPGSAPHGLSVSPARPTTRSTITFGFTAPVASGVHSGHEISYSLSVSGPAGAGCIGVREAGGPGVARGARATISLGPAQLGRPWCPGTYTARAIELRRPHCTGSAPCPQYIAVVGVVGRASFTVRRS